MCAYIVLNRKQRHADTQHAFFNTHDTYVYSIQLVYMSMSSNTGRFGFDNEVSCAKHDHVIVTIVDRPVLQTCTCKLQQLQNPGRDSPSWKPFAVARMDQKLPQHSQPQRTGKHVLSCLLGGCHNLTKGC